ncbi:MAG: invasion associated locus B family protein [Magnetococcales bacterium]|nr:invasion associated locus B family protein [Magnetococcales bacterium]
MLQKNFLFLVLAIFVFGFGWTTAVQAKPENGKVFGNWTVQCSVPPGTSEAQCGVSQTLVINETKARLITVEANQPAKGDLNLVVLLPLGISLQAGVTLAFEDASKLPMNLQRCVAEGCLATVAIKAEQLKKMQSQKEFKVHAELPGIQETAKITVSLKGFGDAIDSLK